MSRYHLAEYLVSSSSNQDEEIAVDKIKENNPSEDHLSLEWTTAYIVDQEAEVEEDYVEDQEGHYSQGHHQEQNYAFSPTTSLQIAEEEIDDPNIEGLILQPQQQQYEGFLTRSHLPVVQNIASVEAPTIVPIETSKRTSVKDPASPALSYRSRTRCFSDRDDQETSDNLFFRPSSSFNDDGTINSPTFTDEEPPQRPAESRNEHMLSPVSSDTEQDSSLLSPALPSNAAKEEEDILDILGIDELEYEYDDNQKESDTSDSESSSDDDDGSSTNTAIISTTSTDVEPPQRPAKRKEGTLEQHMSPGAEQDSSPVPTTQPSSAATEEEDILDICCNDELDEYEDYDKNQKELLEFSEGNGSASFVPHRAPTPTAPRTAPQTPQQQVLQQSPRIASPQRSPAFSDENAAGCLPLLPNPPIVTSPPLLLNPPQLSASPPQNPALGKNIYSNGDAIQQSPGSLINVDEPAALYQHQIPMERGEAESEEPLLLPRFGKRSRKLIVDLETTISNEDLHKGIVNYTDTMRAKSAEEDFISVPRYFEGMARNLFSRPFVRNQSRSLQNLTKRNMIVRPVEKEKFESFPSDGKWGSSTGEKASKKKGESTKSRKCDTCGKVINSPTGYRLHLRIHTGSKEYKCGECGKTFRQQSHLTTHTRVHNKERSLIACDQCGKLYKNASTLRNHKKLHNSA